jgi:hypothetical protein
MTNGGPLVDLGDLSKPATVLVEKVCNAVGIIYEPTRIRRKAQAEVDAEKIKALARIELTALQERSIERLVHQEARKQENIEQITAQAAAALPPDAKVENLEEDWVAHFFKQCDTVSDREMQSLWARLLAGEATTPGTFSKRTVDLISTIDKADAELFTRFCQFVWVIGDVVPLIYDFANDIYKSAGITFDSLKHLDAIGLISLETIAGYQRQGFGKYGRVYYYGQQTNLEFPADTNNNLETGHALLTTVGKQLVPICGSKSNNKFYEYAIEKWFARGIITSSVLPIRIET